MRSSGSFLKTDYLTFICFLFPTPSVLKLLTGLNNKKKKNKRFPAGQPVLLLSNEEPNFSGITCQQKEEEMIIFSPISSSF